MSGAISPTGISNPSTESSFSSAGTFSVNHARRLVNDYAEGESPSDQTSKVLNAFLEHLPSESAGVVADDIISNSNDLTTLADHYITSILVPIRAGGGKTPKPVSMRPGMSGDDIDEIAATITPQTRNQTKLKADCLARDGNRCQITGAYDVDTMTRLLPDTEVDKLTTVNTEASHIIPFSMAAFSDADRHSKSQLWEAIYHMFPNVRSFTTDDINDTRNAMTICAAFHTLFGRLNLCLEPTATTNRYRVKKYRGFPSIFNNLLPSDSFVTFTAHDGRFPLPDPKLLSLHASIGAVLHASGMAEIIQKVLEDRKELHCLAADGSTQVGMLLLVF
ncbi:MAG: hypothetical protein M1839_000831 [Geoglossum umbratile]|nr:MAG: hypothetical protein M1839_000831 [Geoglossum umbratile]